MAALTAQVSTPAGTAVTLSAATATTGDTFPNDGNTTLLIQNGDSNPTTATITSHKTASEGLAVADKTVTVAAGVTKIVALDPTAFNDPAAPGVAKVVLSNVTACKVAAIRVP